MVQSIYLFMAALQLAGIWAPQAGIKPRPLAVRVQSPSTGLAGKPLQMLLVVQKLDLSKGFLVPSNKTLLRKMTHSTVLKDCIHLHIYKFTHIYIDASFVFTICIHICMHVYILAYFIENWLYYSIKIPLTESII